MRGVCTGLSATVIIFPLLVRIPIRSDRHLEKLPCFSYKGFIHPFTLQPVSHWEEQAGSYDINLTHKRCLASHIAFWMELSAVSRFEIGVRHGSAIVPRGVWRGVPGITYGSLKGQGCQRHWMAPARTVFFPFLFPLEGLPKDHHTNLQELLSPSFVKLLHTSHQRPPS